MPRGLNQREVGKWKTRIKAAKHYFDDQLKASEEIVRFYQRKNYFADKRYLGAVRVDRRFPANMVWANTQSMLPSIYAGVPRVLVGPRGPFQGQSAKNQQKWFNHLLPQIDWRKKRRRAIRTTILRGWSVTKVVWNENIPGVFAPASEPRDGDLSIPSGAPFIVPLSCHEFLCDPDCNLDLSKAKWVAHRFRRPVEDIKKDKVYSESAREQVSGSTLNSTFADFYRGKPQPTGYSDQNMTEGYEVWIRNVGEVERKLLVISNEVDSAMRFDDWPYAEIETFPFGVTTFHEYEDEEDIDPGLPIPESQAWIPLQQALNILLSKMITHIDRFDRVLGIDSSRMESGADVEKAVMGGDGQHYMVNGPPRDVVVPQEHAQLPPEYFGAFDRVMAVLQQVSGIGELQRGEIPGSATATGASIQQGNASLRAGDRRQMIADADVQLLRLMKQITQERFEDGVLIPTPDEDAPWIKISGEDLRAELDVTINIDSIAPESTEGRKARWLNALQMIGPILTSQQGVPSAMRELLHRILDDLGFEDSELFLPPLTAGIPEEEHNQWLMGLHPQVLPTDDDAAHIAAHNAFIGKYGATLQTAQGMAEEIQAHIANHQDQMASKRAGGTQSVRGRLRPMAPAPGTPGALTGTPMAESSMNASPNIGA